MVTKWSFPIDVPHGFLARSLRSNQIVCNQTICIVNYMYFLSLFFGNLAPMKRDIAPINCCIFTRKTWNGIRKIKFVHNRVPQLIGCHCILSFSIIVIVSGSQMIPIWYIWNQRSQLHIIYRPTLYGHLGEWISWNRKYMYMFWQIAPHWLERDVWTGHFWNQRPKSHRNRLWTQLPHAWWSEYPTRTCIGIT